MKAIYSYILVFLFFLGLSYPGFAQDNKIQGSVINDLGQPLAGAHIIVLEKPGIGTHTNQEGKFVINAKPENHLTVTWRHKMRKTIEITKGKEQLHIHLGAGSILVPAGNGRKVRQEELTSAIGMANASDLNESVMDAGNALYGKIPGLWVLQNAGLPSQRSPSLQIRGIATPNNNDILVLINGFERPLSSINVEEINSVSVLKDAAAKAIYGQRGANGVLLITTKRGGNHQTQYHFSMEGGITVPTRLPEFLDAPSYARALNEARKNDGLASAYLKEEIKRFSTGNNPFLYPDVDWMDQVLKNWGYMTRFNFNANGGNGRINYYVDLNYQRQLGLYEHTDTHPYYSSQVDYNQFNLRTNANIELTPSTVASIDLAAMIRNLQKPGVGGILYEARRTPSLAYPIRNADGSYGGTSFFGNNPVARLENTGYSLNNRRDLFLTGKVKQNLNKLINGLSATVKLGYDAGVSSVEEQTRSFIYKQVTPVLDGTGNITGTREQSFGTQSNLSPNRRIGGYHVTHYNVEARLNYLTFLGRNKLKAFLMFHQDGQRTGNNNNTYRWQRFAGNVHYDISGKYFIDAVFSYAGSNRIQNVKDRWGLFPALSGAWLLSKESFLMNSKTINYLKLRASWGASGNGLIPIENLTSNRYGNKAGNNYRFTDNNVIFYGYTQLVDGIPQKTFETSNEFNVGIDARFFKKLSFTGDVFYAKRKNILVGSNGKTSAILGINSGSRTDGIVQNKGFELQLKWQDKLRNFTYSIGAQLSYAKSKILKNDQAYVPYDYLKKEGNSLRQWYGLLSYGLFNNPSEIANSPVQTFGIVAPGDIKYIDANNDGIINQYDRVPIGFPSFPEMYYSARLGLGYKGIHISAIFQGAGMSSVMLDQPNVFWPLLQGIGNMSTWYTNYWSPTNKDAALPRLTTLQNKNNFQTNDIWLRNGSFVKLRYVELSYAFSSRILQKWKLENLKVYVRGRNLFSLDHIRYLDPEEVHSNYPSLRTFNLGIKVNF